MAGMTKETRAALQAEIDDPGTDRHRAMMLKNILAREPEAADQDDDANADDQREVDIKLAGVRHRFEKDGHKWNGPASMGFAMAVGEWIKHASHKSFINHRDQIRALKKEVAELKEIAGHTEKHFVKFGGEFQLDRPYYENTIVTFKGLPYIAGRDVAEGKADPPRAGSGWIKLF